MGLWVLQSLKPKGALFFIAAGVQVDKLEVNANEDKVKVVDSSTTKGEMFAANAVSIGMAASKSITISGASTLSTRNY